MSCLSQHCSDVLDSDGLLWVKKRDVDQATVVLHTTARVVVAMPPDQLRSQCVDAQLVATPRRQRYSRLDGNDDVAAVGLAGWSHTDGSLQSAVTHTVS